MPSKYDELNDEQWLREKYHGEGLTQAEIADIVGCSDQTVSVAMERHDIEKRTSAERARKEIDDRLNDEDWLREEYWQKGRGLQDLADQFSCGRGTVKRRMREYGVEIRESRRFDDEKLDDADWLREQYHDRKKSANDIAAERDVSPSVVEGRMEENGIERRAGGSTPNRLENGLSERFRQIIIGELLGDGCISQFGENSRGSYFAYTTSRKEYRDWLAEQFRNEGYEVNLRSRVMRHTPDGTCAPDWSNTHYFFSTSVYVSLLNIREQWYSDGTKIIPDSFELTPLKLRHWHIGDGSYKKSGEITLSTHGFDDSDRRRLTKAFDDCRIVASAYADGTIGIRKGSIDRYFEYMAAIPKEIEDVYGYKWP